MGQVPERLIQGKRMQLLLCGDSFPTFSISIVRRRGVILRMGQGKDCSFPDPRIGTWGARLNRKSR